MSVKPVTLRTGRLELSTLGPDDIDALIAACQDPDIPRYTSVPSPFGRDEAQQLVAKTAAGWASGEHLVWGIRHGAALMGVVGLYRVDGRGSGELGYWLAASARGRGILTEAARTALDWGFAPADAGGAGLHRIEWHAVVGNDASARVAQTLGFRFEGVRRDALLGEGGRVDGWAAALLATDDRAPRVWPVTGG